MAFCSFSKDYDTACTIIENKFITKYLPDVDGFAVKVYLYGLFLCQNTDSDFTLRSMAEVLKTDEEKIKQAYSLWEDYDLVQILSQEPFTLQYLPVRSAIGKAKKIHYEQYADFNKELQRKMQKVGKFISAGDYIKYMRFLEENNIQPQAFLLIAEYCVNKQGAAVVPSYIFNKAKKLIQKGKTTYDQVEKELSNYNANEGNLLAVFSALSILRNPDETDYSLYENWLGKGFSQDGIIAAAKKQKRGSMNSLDLALGELAEKGKLETEEIERYLNDREMLANLTFRLGRKLGVKVQNPAPYIDEYVEKWYLYGYEEGSLLDVALFCLKTERGNFEAMHELLQNLFNEGIVSAESVKEFLKEKNDELKLFVKIQSICGGIRKNAANLSLIKTWRAWNFSNEMILEAATRSAGGANPVPYMNKILSDWKQKGVFTVQSIPVPVVSPSSTSSQGYISPAIEAANAKADRERYYAILREKALTRAEKFVAKANANERFKEVVKELSKMEISLAKAEVFDQSQLPDLQRQKEKLLLERKDILTALGIDEQQLLPQYACKRCLDTGFLPEGTACNCYKPEQ
ncbi:MAG: DnaD domain protein [Clostridia bacterium]|nr:DnaD domain protein [Clostridia bacterium]